MTGAATITLEDKWTRESGHVMISGIQALVRLLLEQRRLDTRRGLDTGMYVTGYPGSPLGGLDTELARARSYLEPAGIVFEPAINEELAATSVGGTQLVGELPGRRRDGVVGFWFGKNPGLDRAADAIRHCNVSGTARLGGAVALIGDDPWCKSSTLPSSCEPMCRSLVLPLLTPATVSDVIPMGLHAVALSRHAGLWTGVRIVSDIADAAATVAVDDLARGIPDPPAEDRGSPPTLLGASSVAAEHDLMTVRLDRVAAYVREHELNRVAFEPSRPRLAIVAAGTAYAMVERALEDLGIGDGELDALGIRLVRLGMPWPLPRDDVRRLLGGVERVLVVEDKLGVVEGQVKDALYRQPGAPAVLGREDEEGRPLVPVRGGVDADGVATVLGAVFGAELPEAARAQLRRIAERQALPEPKLASPARVPFFCSGCPHNASTKAAPDQLVGAGIGCHALVAMDPTGARGHLLGAPQMGGEGAQWLGMAPFTSDEHYVQNIGDGTFHHSGSLAIRAAVAGEANMTFKLLYNDAIAMTGGQRAPGRLDVASLTFWLALEGVRQVIVTTPEPESYREVSLSPIASVRHRDDFAAAEAELAAAGGVTVLIHDDRCATEDRRLRKRDIVPAPAERVWINERVCEGCGDCGAKSTCLSVLPVETEFGRKTQIHQSSCNQDFSCLEGDCPSFVEVVGAKSGASVRKSAPAEPPVALPDPPRGAGDDVLIRMPGIGGTGVVTISRVLQMAAMLDGRHAGGVDQTGLAQKGGPVISDLRISATPVGGALRASAATCDLLLGFDVLGAGRRDTLAVCDPERTRAVVNTHAVPTAGVVLGAPLPNVDGVVGRIERQTRPGESVFVDAQELAEQLFGDHLQANMLVVGVAHQRGWLPLAADAIERALELNGAGVAANVAAFRWGRAYAVDPEAVRSAVAVEPAAPKRDERAEAILAGLDAEGELRALLDVRVPELVAYQSPAYARRYADEVMRVAAIERERGAPGATPVAEAYARGLHKLMAYKDEYEVARLHLDELERAKLTAAFGTDVRVRVLLHPPALRALGLRRKLRLGATAAPTFRVLRRMRRLRGSALDPFGYAHVRRVERRLIGEYRDLVSEALAELTPENRDEVAAIAGLPDLVRGYEQIKLDNVERFRAEATRLLAALRADEPRVETLEVRHTQ